MAIDPMSRKKCEVPGCDWVYHPPELLDVMKHYMDLNYGREERPPILSLGDLSAAYDEIIGYLIFKRNRDVMRHMDEAHGINREELKSFAVLQRQFQRR